MKSLAIIPARGGSKRIPGKNIKNFLGLPIIAYSIKAALNSGIFDEVMVSTDDEEIAEIAKSFGASVPFMRSESTSNDYATTADVVTEVLSEYSDRGIEFDIIACIYATAPFITADRLKDAMHILINGKADSVFTCVEFSYPVLRSLVIDSKGYIGMKWPEFKNSRSQDLEKFYHDAGQFYMSTVEAFKKAKGFWGEKTVPVIMSELEVQDLDTPTDWALAEMKYTLLT